MRLRPGKQNKSLGGVSTAKFICQQAFKMVQCSEKGWHISELSEGRAKQCSALAIQIRTNHLADLCANKGTRSPTGTNKMPDPEHPQGRRIFHRIRPAQRI
jgi:hypothetical protein